MLEISTQKSESLHRFFHQDSDGLYYLSHASILVKLSGVTILFDPVLAKPPHLGSWLFYPEMKIDRCLLDVDFVVVSHQHQDHFDVDFLLQLKKATILIVSGRPQFEDKLRASNIKFNIINEEEIFTICRDIKIIGLNHEYNNIDSATIVYNENFSVYHGNDCFLSNSKLQLIKKHCKSIDVACIPFAYVHWYPFLLEDVSEEWKKQEAEKLINKYLKYGITQAEFLEAKVCIPFGANMFYNDDVYSDHNKAVVTPFDFLDYAFRNESKIRFNIFTLFAGDIVNKNQGDFSCSIHMSSLSRSDLYRDLNLYIEKIGVDGNGFDSRAIIELPYKIDHVVDFINNRLQNVNFDRDFTIYIANAEDEKCEILCLKLHESKCCIVESIESTDDYYFFKMTNLAYRAYLSSLYSFNEIIASSQFRLSRYPNEYNLNVLRIINNVL